LSTRIISEAQHQRLEDLSAEGLLSGLSVGIAEKDIHVTDLLRNLSTLKVEHSHFQRTRENRTRTHIDDGIKLIFAGGTCLSKAHGTIRRMSEDIDMKIVLETPSMPLANDIGTRARLKALHSAIEGAIKSLGFEIPPQVDDKRNPVIRDSCRYYILNSRYGTRSRADLGLRPELKLEMIQRAPKLEPRLLAFGYLYERLADLSPTNPVTMLCIDPAETLAEKVLSLLRRCAWQWSGHQNNPLDPTLVRHVYDVHQIHKADPATVELARTVFKALVETDIIEFKGQNPGFDRSPGPVLLETLESARKNEALTRQYDDRVLRLIYGNERPTYKEAFGTFELVARTLLEVM
jgi:nucleotidyltransferase AbiEii toxin of type IV toxin-antitoxin system